MQSVPRYLLLQLRKYQGMLPSALCSDKRLDLLLFRLFLSDLIGSHEGDTLWRFVSLASLSVAQDYSHRAAKAFHKCRALFDAHGS